MDISLKRYKVSFIFLYMTVLLCLICDIGIFQKMALLFILFIILLITILKRNKYTLYIFMFIIAFQDFFLLVFSNYLDINTTRYILIYKEIIVYGTVCIYLVFKNKLHYRSDKCSIIFILILIINLLIYSRSSISIAIISLRQLITPVILYLFGRSLNKLDIEKIIKVMIILSIFACIFGFVEVFVLKDEFWINMGISKFAANRGMLIYEGSLPGNFYTADLSFIYHGLIRRMASFFINPIAFGHFVVIPLLFIIYNKELIKINFIRVGIIMLFLASIILTLSKGVFIILIVSLIFYSYFIKKWKLCSLFFILILLGLVYIEFYYGFKSGNSVSVHINGFNSSLQHITIFGKGLGTSGYTTKISSGFTEDAVGSESFIGVLIYQVGIIGLFTYFKFNTYVIKQMYVEYIKENESIYLLLLSLVIGVFIESIGSESAISYIGTGMLFILVGIQFGKISEHFRYGDL